MLRQLILSLVLFCILSNLDAQPWIQYIPEEKRNNPDEATFYEIQQNFNEYWSDKTIEKGKGWKQFKRWENFMEPRVYPSGIIDKTALWKEHRRLETLRSTQSIVANWTQLGPVNTPLDFWGGRSGSGRVNCVAFHPTDNNIIFCGSPSGGFWKSVDGGNNWQTTTDELLSIGVSDIAIHPVDPNVIYIATGDGDAGDTYTIGILKSTDGGLTWNSTGSAFNTIDNYTFSRLIINPADPSILLGASSNGIYRTLDDGATWVREQTGSFRDIEFKPGDPSVVYATSGGYIYRSTNGGDTFTILSTTGIPSSSVGRISIAVTPANPEMVYALCSKSSDSGFYGMFRSSDAADTWEETLNSSSINLLGWDTQGGDQGGQGWYDLALAVSPTNANELYVGGVNIWKSTNGGSSFSLNAHWYGGGGVDYVHADQHVLAFNNNNGVLYSGNDGGLYKTSNGGSSWSDLSDGLEILQLYKHSVSTEANFKVSCGAQDNGTFRYSGGIWNNIYGGDGMETIIDHTNSNIIYAEVYYGAIAKSTDGGYNWTDIQPAGSGNGAWVTPYIMHPEDNNTLFAGYTSVFKTTNGGNSWDQISQSFGGSIQSLAISATNDDYIYAGTLYNLFRTKNGGATWEDVTTGLPSNSITYIAVSQHNPEKIWVSVSGYSQGKKVYVSENAGDSWVNYSQDLPNIPANCIVYEKNSAEALYVGTDLGVYYRDKTMTGWIPFSDGLPNVIVNELEINYASEKIVAATYGRGVWVSDLYSEIVAPAADFSSYVASPCDGLIQLFDLSSGQPDSWLWDFGNGETSTLQNPSFTAASSGTFTVSLTVTNTQGTDVITKDIIISGDAMTSSFISSSSSFCSYPASVSFTNTSLYAGTYSWDFGDGNTSTLENPTHSYSQYGNFTVSLTVTSPLCGSDTYTVTDMIQVDPANSSDVLMPASGVGPTVQCCNGIIKDSGGDDIYAQDFTAITIIQPPGAEQLTLSFNVFDIEEGSNPSVCDYDYLRIYDGPNTISPIIGKYCNNLPPPATITTSGGAVTLTHFSDPYVTGAGFEIEWNCLITGTEHQIIPAQVSMYPNPVKDQLNISFDNLSDRSVIQIIDMMGKEVLRETIDASSGVKTLKMSNLSDGLYQVIISGIDQQYIQKIVLEK